MLAIWALTYGLSFFTSSYELQLTFRMRLPLSWKLIPSWLSSARGTGRRGRGAAGSSRPDGSSSWWCPGGIRWCRECQKWPGRWAGGWRSCEALAGIKSRRLNMSKMSRYSYLYSRRDKRIWRQDIHFSPQAAKLYSLWNSETPERAFSEYIKAPKSLYLDTLKRFAGCLMHLGDPSGNIDNFLRRTHSFNFEMLKGVSWSKLCQKNKMHSGHLNSVRWIRCYLYFQKLSSAEIDLVRFSTFGFYISNISFLPFLGKPAVDFRWSEFQPDRPFHYYKASESVARRFRTT